MHLVTNFPRFPEQWETSQGVSGTASYAAHFEDFIAQAARTQVLLINCDASLTLRLCRHRWPAGPRPRIVSVDIVLRRPETWTHRFTAFLKARLLKRVDLFINYFTDLRGYEHYYGITPARSAFVPFKANLRHRYPVTPDADGDAVLCLGRSMRDYDTFFQAMEQLPHPAVIPRPDFAQLAIHRSRFTRPLDQLPPNVRVLDDDGSEESLVRLIRQARIVALPILPSTLCASGISVYLNAMLLGKCVILTQGPGASDILTDQAILVPPANPRQLAEAIDHAWRDDELRHRTAARGHQYALSLGGEPELRQRLLEVLAERYPIN